MTPYWPMCTLSGTELPVVAWNARSRSPDPWYSSHDPVIDHAVTPPDAVAELGTARTGAEAPSRWSTKSRSSAALAEATPAKAASIVSPGEIAACDTKTFGSHPSVRGGDRNERPLPPLRSITRSPRTEANCRRHSTTTGRRQDTHPARLLPTTTGATTCEGYEPPPALHRNRQPHDVDVIGTPRYR